MSVVSRYTIDEDVDLVVILLMKMLILVIGSDSLLCY